MNSEPPDRKELILGIFGPALEKRGYKYVASRSSFEKKSADDRRAVSFQFSRSQHGSCSVAVGCAIRVNAIEEIYHRTSGIDKKYQHFHTTVGLFFAHRGGIAWINSAKEVEAAVRDISDFIERKAMPFLERAYSIRDYSDMLNDSLETPCPFQMNKATRGHKGVIAAKLANDERYESLVDYYSALFKTMNEGFFDKRFARLLADLRGEKAPEPPPAKPQLPKNEQKKRRLLSKELPSRVQEAIKGTVWKSKQGVLHREFKGWYVEAGALVSLAEVTTRMMLTVKPMALDPLFWEMTGMRGAARQPLSFRSWGAFTCRAPAIAETSSQEPETADEIAARLLSWAEAEVDKVISALTLDGFIEHVRSHPNRITHLDTLVTSFILAERYEEARQLCSDALATKKRGTFTFMGEVGSRSFIEIARDWLSIHGRPSGS